MRSDIHATAIAAISSAFTRDGRLETTLALFMSIGSQRFGAPGSVVKVLKQK